MQHPPAGTNYISTAMRGVFSYETRAWSPSRAHRSLINCRLGLDSGDGVVGRLALSRPAGDAVLAGLPGFLGGDSGSTEAGWTGEGSGLAAGGAGGGGIGAMIVGALTGFFVLAGLGSAFQRTSTNAPSSRSATAAATMA